ncbi:SHOCT domain-containing protein [Georgenia sp. SYP-B2076]|uniref:SHOCT domain-containing protein n=1 Tax=Georgenia sp. SYP-B2076 TaxID=2495881 RepID=UPI000F8E1FD0|nr:SHOCT domain-containing protein [Georgenia sp. SYP-B2076]
MSGLLRGIARTAVVAGTATSVSNRVSRRQAGRWAAQDAQWAAPQEAYVPTQPAYAPPQFEPPAQDMDAKLAQLKELAALKEQGILTDAELEVQKRRILSS